MKKFKNLLLIAFLISAVSLPPMVATACFNASKNDEKSNELELKVTQLQNEKSRMEAQFNEKITIIQNLEQKYKNDISQKEIELSNLKEEISSTKSEIENTKNKYNSTIDNLNNSITDLRKEIEELKKQKQAYEDDVRKNENQATALQNEVEKSKNTIAQLQKEIDSKNLKAIELQNNLDQASEKYSQVLKLAKEKETQYQLLEKEISSNKLEIDRLDKEKSSLISLHNKEIADKENKISSLISELNQVKKELDSLVSDAEILLNIYKQNSALLSKYQKQYNQLKSKFTEVKTNRGNKEIRTELFNAYSEALKNAYAFYTLNISQLNLLSKEIGNNLVLNNNKVDNPSLSDLKELILISESNQSSVISSFNNMMQNQVTNFNQLDNSSSDNVTFTPISKDKNEDFISKANQVISDIKTQAWSSIQNKMNEVSALLIKGLNSEVVNQYNEVKNKFLNTKYNDVKFGNLFTIYQELLVAKENIIEESTKANAKLMQTISEIKNQIQQLNSRIAQYGNQYRNLQHYNVVAKDLKDINNNLDSYNSLFDLARKTPNDINNLEQEFNSYEIEFNKLKNDIQALFKELNIWNTKLHTLLNKAEFYKNSEEFKAIINLNDETFNSINNTDFNTESTTALAQKLSKATENFEKESRLYNEFIKELNDPRSFKEMDEFYNTYASSVQKIIANTKAERKPGLNNKAIYDSIFKRSFNLQFWQMNQSNPNSYSIVSGTGWLLDYVDLGNNKYRLYIGTNMHVANSNVNPDEYEENKQTSKIRSGELTERFTIGFDPKWEDHRNQYYMFEFSRNNYDDKKYMPKNFFVAKDHMDRSVLNSSVAADFAVLEWYVDLNDFSRRGIDKFPYVQRYAFENYVESRDSRIYENLIARRVIQNSFANHIREAIAELDASKNKVQTTQIANFSNSLPYINVDYMSANAIAEEFNKMYPNSKIHDYLQPINYASSIYLDEMIKNNLGTNLIDLKPNSLLIGGYPAENHLVTEINGDWNKINTNTDNINAFSDAYNDIEMDIRDGRVGQTEYDNTTYNQYMLQYSVPATNALLGGSSGSIALNQDGLPVGIKWGIRRDANVVYNDANRRVNQYSDVVVSFVNTFDKKSKYYGSQTLYAYNLIDGSDKNKYPKQTNSYRERLIKVYGNNVKTALFK
ncbi:MIP family Ig-specific serine endopeptidase [Mycoplasma sp. VS30B]